MPDRTTTPITHSAPAMVFDVTKFQHLLDDPSVSQEGGEAFLKAIWDIFVLILDFGLRVEFPENHPQGAENSPETLDGALADMLSSKDTVLTDKMEADPTPCTRSVRRKFNESR